MVSVEKWKNHFKRLAHKAFPKEDMYIVAQSGRGLGRNSYKRTLYQIRTPSGSGGGKPTVEIVSPVASTLERAKALTKTIKRKKKTKSASTATKRRGKNTSSRKKRAAPKTKRKKRTKKAATPAARAGIAAGARYTKRKTKKKTTKTARRKKSKK